jgi:chromosomal replication initiation ATPase DnaA
LTNTVTIIAQEVSRATGVTVTEILSERRAARIALARHMCFALARDLTTHSFPKIARAFRRKDHTTVIYALRAWPAKARSCETYRQMAQAREAIEARLAPALETKRAVADVRGLVAA